MRELARERNRSDDEVDPRLVVRAVFARGGHFLLYAAVADLATGLALDAGGADNALAVLEDIWERAHAAGLHSLDRYLAALRVTFLTDAGRYRAAERTWHAAGLPSTDAGCLNLGTLTWREVEAVSCARIRLLAAIGNPGAGEALERALARTAQEHDLQRMLMRAVALRVRLCHEAGDHPAVLAAAEEYLELFARTDYAQPLLGVGAAAWPVLQRIAQTGSPRAGAAERLLAMGRDRVKTPSRLTGGEIDVLRRLTTQRDKQIAVALGLSVHGVRDRVRTLFRKLAVRQRAAPAPLEFCRPTNSPDPRAGAHSAGPFTTVKLVVRIRPEPTTNPSHAMTAAPHAARPKPTPRAAFSHIRAIGPSRAVPAKASVPMAPTAIMSANTPTSRQGPAWASMLRATSPMECSNASLAAGVSSPARSKAYAR